MTRMDRRPHLSVAPCDLPADLRRWLDSQNFGRLPTLTKDGALKFLNDRGMPVRRNAVVTAFGPMIACRVRRVFTASAELQYRSAGVRGLSIAAAQH